MLNVKITRFSHVLVHRENQCVNCEAAICSNRFFSVSMQVGAHPWHKGPAGGCSGILCYKAQALPVSHLLAQESKEERASCCRLNAWSFQQSSCQNFPHPPCSSSIKLKLAVQTTKLFPFSNKDHVHFYNLY